MATTMQDGPSWEEKVGGDLNPSSHAAAEMFKLTCLAIQLLEQAEHKVTPVTVQAMAKTLLHIVSTAHAALVDQPSPQAYSYGFLRLALETALTEPSLPNPPFGDTPEAFDEWTARMIKRVNSIAVTAVLLWRDGPGDRPWQALFPTEGAAREAAQ
jgi:hypothetical protein